MKSKMYKLSSGEEPLTAGSAFLPVEKVTPGNASIARNGSFPAPGIRSNFLVEISVKESSLAVILMSSNSASLLALTNVDVRQVTANIVLCSDL